VLSGLFAIWQIIWAVGYIYIYAIWAKSKVVKIDFAGFYSDSEPSPIHRRTLGRWVVSHTTTLGCWSKLELAPKRRRLGHLRPIHHRLCHRYRYHNVCVNLTANGAAGFRAAPVSIKPEHKIVFVGPHI